MAAAENTTTRDEIVSQQIHQQTNQTNMAFSPANPQDAAEIDFYGTLAKIYSM